MIWLQKLFLPLEKDGLINVEDGFGETKVTYSSGYLLDRGLVDPAFVTDHQKLTAEYDDCYVFVYNGTLELTEGFISVLKKVSEERKPLLIVSKNYADDCINTLIHNNSKGAIKCAAIKAPGFGDISVELMKDLGVVTNAKVFSSRSFNDFDSFALF